MDPDKTLEFARTMVLAWEQAANTDAEHAAARELSSAFSALDDFLSHGGRPPADWSGGRDTGGSVLTMVQEFAQAASQAIRAEDTDGTRHDRIVNRLLWGHPAGAEGVAAEAMKAASMRPATGMSDDPGPVDSGPSVWHMLTRNPVAPDVTHPVFARDFREIDPGGMDGEAAHPLLGTCACGEEVTRDEPSEEWHHTDPRL